MYCVHTTVYLFPHVFSSRVPDGHDADKEQGGDDDLEQGQQPVALLEQEVLPLQDEESAEAVLQKHVASLSKSYTAQYVVGLLPIGIVLVILVCVGLF